MLDIHEPNVIRKMLVGKAVWLEPLEGLVFYPLLTVLGHIHDYVNKGKLFGKGHQRFAPEIMQEIRDFQSDVARLGHKPQTAHDQIELCRVQLKVNRPRMEQLHDKIEEFFNKEIIWCLVLLDFDLNFKHYFPFIEELVKFNFPNLMLFLVRDECTTLTQNIEKANVIIGVDKDEMHAIIADIDLHTLLANTPEPEDEPEYLKKGIRSIDEE